MANHPSVPDTLPYPSLKGASLEAVLQLARAPGVGPITFFDLLSLYGTPERALEAARRALKKGQAIPSKETIAREITATQAAGATFLMYGDGQYPALLQHIYDPPPVLIVKGHASLFSKPCVGVVGSRHASANGRAMARQLAFGLGKAGYAVASGLARGIDGEAHQASLASGTIAVIAGGIDSIYPPEHAALQQQIEETGLLVTEQPIGFKPVAQSFPRRNRIISGISQGVVVVEASVQSGSLITARMANDHGREVFAVPGSPLDPRSNGCNHLIQQGATLVQTAADVDQALRQQRNTLYMPSHAPYQPQPAAAPDGRDVEDARALLLDQLGTAPLSLEELVELLAIPLPLLRAALVELELLGEVERHFGNRFSRIFIQQAESR